MCSWKLRPASYGCGRAQFELEVVTDLAVLAVRLSNLR